VINTDKNPAYGEALQQLKRDDPNVEAIEHRQAKYLNNRVEADHGPIRMVTVNEFEQDTSYTPVLKSYVRKSAK
jgi:transposase-like protein